ncbi:pyrimidine operon attenuation protein / uracil phosphoribosyltransferase [Salinimicrobium catena]|uniref:Pyrimidine operon attenuation protein / uracil phosphoribosyltransferase n=1 Tax=Salinimicrobium catena TaxID=390640 RepID=A0A1H5PFK8_9FLAO|nr:phosphoribosyltransferase family protein [Salinimicrobium catena]SDL85148.1 pyrimidine operon attenuation protein / uracil phosphoribosyltransferase [Salinimicrobium catena]SEF12692.1 pyrimidine operon attenuation protein / uracil phosphoribosyltransferase [Salinimicrobium catena]
MKKTEVLILDHTEISHKIKRIAYQIYENNVNEDHIVLAGILKSGFELAEKLREELEKISDLKVTLCEVKVNKKDPLQKVETSLPSEEYKDKSIVLVDDVLNSGTTLIYGVRHFLEVPLKQFKTAVLVDRSHKKYPVKADFKGISLSTSINETVKVHFEEDSRVVLI